MGKIISLQVTTKLAAKLTAASINQNQCVYEYVVNLVTEPMFGYILSLRAERGNKMISFMAH